MDHLFPSSGTPASGSVSCPVPDGDRVRRRILPRLGQYEGPLAPIWEVLMRDASADTLRELDKLLREPVRW